MFTMSLPYRGAATDPFAASVIALLPFNGANGSTVFTDLASSQVWAQELGSPTITTAQSKWGGASIQGTSSGSIAISGPGSQWLLDGDYSVECWILTNANGGGASAINIACASGNIDLNITVGGGGITHARAGDSGIGASDGGGSIYGRWIHAFIGRQGTTNYAACNGVMSSTPGNTSVISGPVTRVAACFQASLVGSPYLYLDDLRVTRGVCRHTSSFAVPTGPYTYP